MDTKTELLQAQEDPNPRAVCDCGRAHTGVGLLQEKTCGPWLRDFIAKSMPRSRWMANTVEPTLIEEWKGLCKLHPAERVRHHEHFDSKELLELRTESKMVAAFFQDWTPGTCAVHVGDGKTCGQVVKTSMDAWIAPCCNRHGPDDYVWAAVNLQHIDELEAMEFFLTKDPRRGRKRPAAGDAPKDEDPDASPRKKCKVEEA